MAKTFFFQTKQITDSSSIFHQLKEQNIFFSYFQVDQDYYLFLYAQQSFDINLLYQSVDVTQELDSKKRKIRSLRGFFLYALEIMEGGKDYEILETNLQPFFWRKVKDIIRQNKKGALQEFLFGKAEVNKDTILDSNLLFQRIEKKIQNLQKSYERLQQKIIELENNQTLFGKDKGMESKNLSDPPKIHPRPLSNTQQYKYNLSSNQDKALNKPNFSTLSQIPEDEKIEIIQTGFQRQAEEKISLKKYYESTEESSLFKLKGYSIKYEAIRKNKLYQQLKP